VCIEPVDGKWSTNRWQCDVIIKVIKDDVKVSDHMETKKLEP
jgi:hypothetical protein